MKVTKESGSYRHHRRMLTLVATLLGTAAVSHPVLAQFGHSDVDLGLNGGQIITNQRVYDSFFPTFGISKQFTSNPGFAAESDGLGTIGPRLDVLYDVLDGLLLWDGSEFVVPDDEVRIRIDNNPPGSSSTYVDATTGVQLGSTDPPSNRIGSSSSSGEVHSHVNFFLESGEEDPPIGAYGLKLAISTDSESIVDSEPLFVVFNFGLNDSAYDESLAIYEALLDMPDIVGDFDANGILDAHDIDLLTNAVLQGSTDPQFDVNADELIDQNDRGHWVTVLRETYFGDADMNGVFNSEDIVRVFEAGEYEDGLNGNSTWSTGDWNGDAEFTNEDFVVAFIDGGYEQGPRSAVAVPEPHGALLFVIGSCIACLVRSHRRPLGTS